MLKLIGASTACAGRPWLQATLEACGVHRDPEALHLLLQRRFRPPEVEEKAKQEAAELDVAMTLAAAEAAARPKKLRRAVSWSPRELT